MKQKKKHKYTYPISRVGPRLKIPFVFFTGRCSNSTLPVKSYNTCNLHLISLHLVDYTDPLFMLYIPFGMLNATACSCANLQIGPCLQLQGNLNFS